MIVLPAVNVANLTADIYIYPSGCITMKSDSFILLLLLATLLMNCHKDKSIRVTNCDNLDNDPEAADGSFIRVPNAFTPNNDGLNDYFRPITVKISKIKFTVIDDRNNILYSTEVLNASWKPFEGIISGKKYYYRVEAEAVSGRKIGLCGYLIPIYICVPKELPKNTLVFEDQLDRFGNFSTPTSEKLVDCN